MAGRVAELAGITALATIVTIAIAAPVLRAPSERVFGMEIVGRHHDPFTVMAQFEHPTSVGVYTQPITDATGAALARAAGPVAAYNWLVLLSFPLSAAATYLLARYLALSPAASVVAALAFAFSPFHLAHAAYHPQVAQTQWIPLYLFALWRCLDVASPAAVALLAVATVAVTLSNFYGGLIAAVITPVAVAAYWAATRSARPHAMRRLGVTMGSLVLIAAVGLAYVSYAAPAVMTSRAAFAFSRDDLFRYSAKWWSYLVPPVANPLLGTTASRTWTAAGVDVGLLEQQVYLGWAIIVLGLVAIVWWRVAARRGRVERSGAMVPVLAIVAFTALVCSLSPERTVGAFTFVRPSAWLYTVVPMFRSYARFGVIVQLMAVLLAGVGVDDLLRSGAWRARLVSIVLVAVAVGEYAVAPAAMSRDVLPTMAHRWITRQPGTVRTLDCAPLDQESASIPWLTADRVTVAATGSDCMEPNLADKLAASGFTHVLVRRDSEDGLWYARHAIPAGLRAAAEFDDSRVFAVTATPPAIYMETMTGFSPREYDHTWSWRWMGADAAWTILNTGTQPITVTANIELSAFHQPRHLELRLDGRAAETLIVEPERRSYDVGPLAVPSGRHELAFHPIEAPTVAGDVAGNHDLRPLSFAVGTWRWIIQGETP